MAKRRGGIDPMAFVTQQQGDRGGLKDLGVLMGLLGLGEGQGEEERQSKAQQALQAYYEGQIERQKAGTEAQTGTEMQRLGLEERKTTAAERAAVAAELAQREAKEFQQEATKRDIEEKLAKTEAPKLQTALEGRNPEEREILLKSANVKEGLQEIAKRRQGKFTTGLGKAYEGFAKDPKAIATFLKAQEIMPGYEEMLKSADWQRLNQGMPAPAPGLLSRLFGGGGGAGTPTAAAPSGTAMPVGVAPQLNTTIAGGYQPGAAFPRQAQEYPAQTVSPPAVDKVMEVAGVTGRNAGPSFVSAPGGPSAMPGVVQQPGFLENFLRQISDYTASRPERVPAERYPYPIGHGVPPTPPIDPRLLQ